MKNTIIIGKFSESYGILGWLKLKSFTEKKKNIFNYFPWKIQNSVLKYYKKDILKWRKHSNNFIVKLKNIHNRNMSDMLSKKNIYIEKKILPELKHKEFYQHEIISCKIFDIHQRYLGKITSILENPIYNTIIIKTKFKKKIYIPFILSKTIKKVDIFKKKIIIYENYK